MPVPVIKSLVPLSMLGILTGDLMTPLGIVEPMLYAIPVFLSGLFYRLETAFGLSIVATVLTYVGYRLSPAGDVSMALTNRLLVGLLIWLSYFVTWFLHDVREQINNPLSAPQDSDWFTRRR